jgi:ATP-dependent helicase HrpB
VSDPASPSPVDEAIPAVRRALAGAGHVVLVAPPGSGKTTIVPLRLLGEPWLGGQRIVVLEPRRLATRAAARRMASLLGEPVGVTVGYTTRDDRRVGRSTRIEVVTEGVLTRRLQHDPSLPGTGAVLFDEVHERNLQTDLGLALALDARAALRPDLRVMAMSATLAGERVAALIGENGQPAPIVTGTAEAHPVDVRWMPRGQKERLEPAVAAAVLLALREEAGDVLAFLPGAAEIRRTGDALAPVVGGDVDLRPLYGMLGNADQDAALAPSPSGRRRVVLATDIAESSLTVEGVRIVVDSGLARAPRFDARTGMTRLRTVPISRASADQRAGRAGRLGPGVTYRLWSKLEHGGRRAHLDPEITQADLAGLALELAAWGVSDPMALRWLDPPPARTFAEARRLLQALGALDDDGLLTDQGRAMAELPLHPRLARMVVTAADLGQGGLACAVAALVEDRDVLRGRPDDLPADLAGRVGLMAGSARRLPQTDDRALGTARRRAHDIAQRAGIAPAEPDPEATGRVLALAYPDRLAIRKGGPGRFQLRTGTRAWLPATDDLAGETFLVAADLDGRRSDARIRLAASLTAGDVAAAFEHEVTEHRTVAWDRERDDLVERVEWRLGGIVLDTVTWRPDPGPATADALLDRVRATGLAALPWTPAAVALRDRVGFLHRHLGEPWPDWSDKVLLADLDHWLAPHLQQASGRADLDAVDLLRVLRSHLGHPLELDRLAPTHVVLAGGRRVELDYGQDPPVLAARVQDLFGTTETPTVVAGRVPVTVHLLSPAGRPVQITSDLAGFWTGSWHEVRKEMAGRYPKHAWPEDPGASTH